MTVHYNKARDRWMFDFQSAGERYQGYCIDARGEPVTSKSAAKQAEGVERRKAAMAPKLPSGEDVTLARVIAALRPKWSREADWPNKQRYAREIALFFGAGTPVRAIGIGRVREYIEFAAAQPIRVWTGKGKTDRNGPDAERYWKATGKTRSPATVNRYLAIVRQILSRAHEMRDPVTQNRVIEHVPQLDDLAEPKRRARPTPEPVLERVLEILPRHTIEAVKLTLFFGFRRGEAFGLKVDQVDFEARGVRLFAEDVKDNEDAFLPGGVAAMAFLRELVDQAHARGVKHLIAWRREHRDPAKTALEPWRPIQSSRRAWSTAMKTIESQFGRRWRWHDLRAAFITHVAMTSGPLAAQKLARHSEYDTTRAYVEVADEMTRLAAERVSERPALRLVDASKKR